MKECARNFEFQQQLTTPPVWTKIFPEHRVCQPEVRDTVAVSQPVATTPTLQGILSAVEFGLDDTTDNSHDIICRPVSVSSMRSCRNPVAKKPTRIIQTVGSPLRKLASRRESPVIVRWLQAIWVQRVRCQETNVYAPIGNVIGVAIAACSTRRRRQPHNFQCQFASSEDRFSFSYLIPKIFRAAFFLRTLKTRMALAGKQL